MTRGMLHEPPGTESPLPRLSDGFRSAENSGVAELHSCAILTTGVLRTLWLSRESYKARSSLVDTRRRAVSGEHSVRSQKKERGEAFRGSLAMDTSSNASGNIRSADRLFTETLWRFLQGFCWILSFREMGQKGLMLSTNQRRNENLLLMNLLTIDPDLEGLLVPIDPNNKRPLDCIRVAKEATRIQTQDFTLALDAASLVFAHSLLDDAALQLGRVTAEASPGSWERFVGDKQIKLKDARDASYESLLQQKLEAYFNQLERESLLRKIDRLFEVCKPDRDFRPVRDFFFDKDRLESLDRLRHDIIHGPGPVSKLPKDDDDISFMKLCGIHLTMMVHKRFEVQLDSRVLGS
jgi:hypothetical protein